MPDSFANYDRASRSWRTSQGCLLTEWAEFSETFPRSGLMQSGTLFRLPPLVPSIIGTASGLWHTPVARDFKGYTKRAGESICNQLRRIYGGTGRPNPPWLAWLMGYPAAWSETKSERSVTASSRRSRK